MRFFFLNLLFAASPSCCSSVDLGILLVRACVCVYLCLQSPTIGFCSPRIELQGSEQNLSLALIWKWAWESFHKIHYSSHDTSNSWNIKSFTSLGRILLQVSIHCTAERIGRSASIFLRCCLCLCNYSKNDVRSEHTFLVYVVCHVGALLYAVSSSVSASFSCN